MSRNQPEPFEATPGNLARRHNPELPAPIAARSPGKRLLHTLAAAVSCTLLVGLSARFVDRPVSSWVHEHLGDSKFAHLTTRYDTHPLAVGPFTLMAGPAEALTRIAPWIVVVLALGIAAGKRWSDRAKIVPVLCLTVLVAMQINKEAKWAFGRTWPESWLGDNPSWIRDGVFGFFPFHGGSGWGSFPSGHTTAITTAATLLWIAWPRLRVLWMVMVTVVVAGLVGANYHFVSDIIGGLYLGGAIALVSAGLFITRNDRIGGSIRDTIGRVSLVADEQGCDQETIVSS